MLMLFVTLVCHGGPFVRFPGLIAQDAQVVFGPLLLTENRDMNGA